MKKINLNIQSSYSLNSNKSIKEVLREFDEFDIISITDHNSVKSCYELLGDFNVKCINGLEADAAIEGYTFDYLCYGFNLDEVDSWVSKTYMTISERQQRIFDKLVILCKEKNIELDMSKEYDFETMYAHDVILEMLSNDFREKYQLKESSDFYRKSTIDTSFPLYIDMRFLWPSLNELVNVIHSNGGLVFLAHPKKYKIDYNTVLDLNKGIVDGIEISNNPVMAEEVEELYNFAKINNLKITYGTNYNGIKNIEKGPLYILDDYEIDVASWINKYLD